MFDVRVGPNGWADTMTLFGKSAGHAPLSRLRVAPGRARKHIKRRLTAIVLNGEVLPSAGCSGSADDAAGDVGSVAGADVSGAGRPRTTAPASNITNRNSGVASNMPTTRFR